MRVHVIAVWIRVEAWSGHILSGLIQIITYLSPTRICHCVQLEYFDCFSASICLIVCWTLRLASLVYGCLGILAKLKSAFLAMTNVTAVGVFL